MSDRHDWIDKGWNTEWPIHGDGRGIPWRERFCRCGVMARATVTPNGGLLTEYKKGAESWTKWARVPPCKP